MLSELTSVGTLFAFVLVCTGVSVLRYRRPNLERKFKVPLGPWLIPGLGALTSAGLICTSTKETIYRLLVWMFIGWVIYFAYGFENSREQINRTTLPSTSPRDEALAADDDDGAKARRDGTSVVDEEEQDEQQKNGIELTSRS